MKLSDIKQVYNDYFEVIRDCEFDSTYLVGKELDESKRVISFIGDKKYIENFLRYDIAGAICTKEVVDELSKVYSGGIAVADNPKTAFFKTHNYIGENLMKWENTYISDTAVIHNSAVIADKGVYIGDNTVICSNVTIKEGTFIGNECIIRENCVLGAPAFYYYGEKDQRKLVLSTGKVKIGNNVELHANSVIEKGVMYGDTIIGDNCKMDNLVVIGHDTKMGRNCTMAGKTVVAGGVSIGDNTFFGVSVSVSPNVVIGKNAKMSSGAVVTKNVEDGQHVSGNFAIPHKTFIEHIKSILK